MARALLSDPVALHHLLGGAVALAMLGFAPPTSTGDATGYTPAQDGVGGAFAGPPDGDAGPVVERGASSDGGQAGASVTPCVDTLDQVQDFSGRPDSWPEWSLDQTIAASGCDWPPGNRYASYPCGVIDVLPLLSLARPLTDLTVVRYGEVDWYRRALGLRGADCAAAADRGACIAALSTAPQAPPDPSGVYLVTTSNGVEQTFTTHDQILGLLGTIDTPTEALVLSWLDRFVSMHDCAPALQGVRSTGAAAFQVVVSERERVPGFHTVLNWRIRYRVEPNGTVTEEARQVASIEQVLSGGVPGRRPPGLTEPHGGPDLGRRFARHAALEAASVFAFEHLHQELLALDAPAELLAEVCRAASDERRHARQVGKLARRYGREPIAPIVAPTPLRDAEAIAMDNAVEGCVGETWGALVGLWQAEHAADPAVAAVMRRLADDEVRHAALSWRLHAWLAGHLDAAARARVDEALGHALDAVVARGANAVGCVATGTPDADATAVLLTQLREVVAA